MTVSCHGPVNVPNTVFEGVTATKGIVGYVDRGKPAPGVDGNRPGCRQGAEQHRAERGRRAPGKPREIGDQHPPRETAGDCLQARGIEAAIAHAMKTNLDASDPVRLNPLLKIERHPDGLTLSNTVMTVKMTSQIEPVVLSECIERGALLSEIADVRAERCGVPHLWTHHEMDAIWRAGVLDEEPFVRARAGQ